LFKHHSAYATFSFQQRSNQNFFGGSYIGLPRGYNSPIPNRITWLSVNYKFPFAYPDWSLNGILYCKRLKMNMFYDFSVHLPKSYKPMRSIGAELTVDTHLFRTIYPFELGFRLAYLPEKDKYVSNFLFSLNLPE
jgi:hypothetical protein